jgi:hypothetical protein
MSVISESLEMTPIVIITNFVSCEHGIEFNWDKSTEFSVGDVVNFIDAFEDEKIKQEHLKWKVKFQTSEGKIHSASQLYFVTTDEWEIISKHFEQ